MPKSKGFFQYLILFLYQNCMKFNFMYLFYALIYIIILMKSINHFAFNSLIILDRKFLESL